MLWWILHYGPQFGEGPRSYRSCPGSSGPRNRKKGIAGAVTSQLAKASAIQKNTLNLSLGAARRNDVTRGVGNLAFNVADDVVAFASGEFASTQDWQAMAGFKMRF